MRSTTAALGAVLLAGFLGSCAPPAVLYTDDLFPQAAPEVVAAWTDGAWARNRSWKTLAAEPNLAELRKDLAALAPGTLVLFALSRPIDPEVLRSVPGLRTLTFGPGRPGPGGVGVDLAGARSEVARRAAQLYPGWRARALFPATTAPADLEAFRAVWTDAGGGPLQINLWPEVGAPAPGPEILFQWVGTEADSLVLALPPSEPVAGDPGTARAPGAPGLTWALNRAALGTFLEEMTAHPEKSPYFLPMETVPTSR